MEITNSLLNVGTDGLNPIEPSAGMDLGVLKQHYGKNLILVGGIDCSQLLPLRTPDQIREATKESLRAAAPGGGFFYRFFQQNRHGDSVRKHFGTLKRMS